MSDFASFVTEPIWCNTCSEHIREVLFALSEKTSYDNVWAEYLTAGNSHIVVGRLRGTSPSEVVQYLKVWAQESIEDGICHTVKIALVGDLPKRDEPYLLQFKPKEEKRDAVQK